MTKSEATSFDHRDLEIKPRNENFELTSDMPRDWLGGDTARTQWFNAMSILFPEGERLFIESVRAYRDEITDPRLKLQVRGFIAQEAIHGREHEHYNELMDEYGLPASTLHRHFMMVVKHARKLPRKAQLAGTCAAEHFTAVLANLVMEDPRFLADAHPTYKAMWYWHAVEETEHKGVAYDVYQEFNPGLGGYLRRVLTFLLVMIVMNARIFYNWCGLMYGAKALHKPKSWFSLINFLWGKPGFYRQTFLPLMTYLRPSFHPWDEDNRELVSDVMKSYNIPEVATAKG